MNYGWPIVEGTGSDPQFVNPLITFGPPFAPTGITVIREDSIYPPQYHNNLLFANFNVGNLRRIVLGGPELRDSVSQSIACSCGQGALFGVMHGLNVPGQDGYIYVTNGDSIFRVVLNNP
jgi:glucose/arabinose dehydrogenase